MSWRSDSAQWVTGAWVSSAYPGLGILGSDMRAGTGTGTNGTGILYNDWQAGDDSKEFHALLVTPPSGTLTLYEDGSFIYAGSTSSFTYQGFVDGVSYGTGTVTLAIGLSVLGVQGSPLVLFYMLRGTT